LGSIKKRKHLNGLTHYNINKCVTEAMIYKAFKETQNRQHINYKTNLRKGKREKRKEKKEKKKRKSAMS